LRLMRKGARLADRLGAPWYAVYVQTPGETAEKIDAATERRLSDSLTLAQQLDGVPFRYKGPDLPSAITAFVQEYGITHVVMGRPYRPWYRRWIGPSLLERILKAVPGVDVVVVDTSG
jgi:two-component system, OmpR family, sensor histidine kinase KdpD